MGILTQAPLTVPVTAKGVTNILPDNLPAGSRYHIYAIDLSVTRGRDPFSLLESGIVRWTGIIQQRNSRTLDFGSQGWTLAEGSTLDIDTGNKKITMNVNILQWSII